MREINRLATPSIITLDTVSLRLPGHVRHGQYAHQVFDHGILPTNLPQRHVSKVDILHRSGSPMHLGVLSLRHNFPMYSGSRCLGIHPRKQEMRTNSQVLLCHGQPQHRHGSAPVYSPFASVLETELAVEGEVNRLHPLWLWIIVSACHRKPHTRANPNI